MSEEQLFEQVRNAFDNRMSAMKVKQYTKRWQALLETYMQGVLATATFYGKMSTSRANQIALLGMCGRLSQTVGYPK